MLRTSCCGPYAGLCNPPVARFKLSDGVAMALAVYARMTARISLVVFSPCRLSSPANSKGSSMERFILLLTLDVTMFATNLSMPLACLVY